MTCQAQFKGLLFFSHRTRVYQREEKHLNNVIANTPEKWVPSSYEVIDLMYMCINNC